MAIPEIARLFPEASIQALDQSSHMLARADETLASSGIRERVELVQGSVYDMPFDDGAFDLVIASQLIHMLDELPAFLNETRRVLGLGGALVIFDFRRDVPRWYRVVAEMSTAVLHAFRVPMDGMGPVIRASYTPKELEAALRDAGFDDVRIDTRLAQVTAHAR